MGSKYIKKQNVSISLQKWHLNTKYKELIIRDNSYKRFDMDFIIKSSISDSEYIIKIKQDGITKIPKVYVISPILKSYSNESIPHTYGMQKINGKEYLQICPFYPAEDWNKNMIIADTVLLWSIEWFYFYEIWLVSGKWCGRWKTSKNKEKIGEIHLECSPISYILSNFLCFIFNFFFSQNNRI